MNKTPWGEYFQFTRSERISIIGLLLLIICTAVAPVFFNNGTKEPQPSIGLYEAEIKQLEEMAERTTRKQEEQRDDYSDQKEGSYRSQLSSLFVFNPNTISDEEWKKLGVRDKTIKTIRNYVAKGGRFRKPEDIGRVYGLSEKEVKRLIPYVKIPDEQASIKDYQTEEKEFTKSTTESRTNYPIPKTIDINTADTSLFIQLPGIGSKLAQRIINFRDKLGGFYSVDQIGETFGLADSVFQKIRKNLICSENATKKININSASTEVLKTHPYIKWSLANAIVQFRAQHGSFRTLTELEQIQLIGPEQLAKLIPYLSVE